MIITHLSADNVLKYKQLQLADLPRQGVITISGQNESGKSTIGETVCFALFGRTFSIGDDDDVTRIIRWGESRCNVRLGFTVGEEEYEIARMLDSDGNHGARLYYAGEEERPIAKGVSAVSEALDELLGYQFEEFVESFYLAQREITTPHPHSHAVKTMAGIAALENVADQLAQDIDNEKRKLPDAEEQIEMVETDIKELAIEPGKLESLQADLLAVNEAGKELQDREEGLQTALHNYSAGLPLLRNSRWLKRLSGFITLIALLSGLASGGAWYLFYKMPDSDYTSQLSSLLQQYITGWSEQSAYYISQLDRAFYFSAATFLLFWLITRVMQRKTSRLQVAGDALIEQLQHSQAPVAGLDDQNIELAPLSIREKKSGETQTDAADRDQPDSDAGDGQIVVEKAEEETAQEEPQADINPADLLAIRACKLDNERTAQLHEAHLQQLHEKKSLQQQLQQLLTAAVDKEQERTTRAAALNDVVSNLSDKLDKIRHRIQINEMADELINAAGRNFSQRFNKDLRELASRTLPLFTEDRYEHLHINDELNVRAFSSLKRDYMDLDEISSGTQRQIMLAVRLALAQELVNTTSGGDQFIFLDEPFAFFDQTRTRNAMAILPKLSEEIRQIWVIAQEFPEDTEYDRAIICSRDYDSLPADE